MVVSLNLVRSCIIHQLSQKGTNKSIFTKHKTRLGKVEEEKEEAETCAWNFHIKNSSLLPGSWCNLKGNRQFYNFSKNIYGTVYKFTKTFSSKFLKNIKKKISIPYPSKKAAKINLFLVYFRTFWILTIKITHVLPWSSPPTSIKGLFGHMPCGPSLLPHTTTLQGNHQVWHTWTWESRSVGQHFKDKVKNQVAEKNK